MEPEFSLPLTLPGVGSHRLQRSLHEQLRAAILGGRLRPGTRLPPTRAFAHAYGISRNTALAIYELLSSEGYVTTRGKGGTFVTMPTLRPASAGADASAGRHLRCLNPIWRKRVAEFGTTSAPLRFDFRLGVPDQVRFPAQTWQRLAARAWRRWSKMPATYSDPQGTAPLREAIARHASFTRAVACSADDVVITSGAQQAFDLLARILVTPGRTVVAIEEPGYPPLRSAFVAAGAKLAPVPVDQEGLIVARLPRTARVIYVTPSHQFPLGTVMSPRRRAELLEFARRHDAVIVEDDYDGEFRFGGRPLDALQTLDRDAYVCYVGTFSKSLFPALRLGFVIAPAWARPALIDAKHAADGHCPVVAQDTLAAFIGEGHMTRHVRRMRRVYAARRDRLLHTLAEYFGEQLELQPGIAGLHVAAFARRPLDIPALVLRARSRDVGLHPLREYYMSRRSRDGLVFGYGAIEEPAIAEGLRCLRRLLAVD